MRERVDLVAQPLTPVGVTELLGVERERTAVRLAALRGDFGAVVEASRDSNADDEHDPEGATIAFERSQLDALVAQAERQLAEVEAALGRVADGSYGTCGVCGSAVPAARLEARPTARTCIGCARPA